VLLAVFSVTDTSHEQVCRVIAARVPFRGAFGHFLVGIFDSPGHYVTEAY
jgi:hypothetical protein